VTNKQDPPVRIRIAEPSPPELPPPSARVRGARASYVDTLKRSPVTTTLCVINIAVMLVAQLTTNEVDSTDTLLRFGAVEPLHVWSGDYWRLVTCMFMHIGWVHLLWNTWAGFGWSAGVERSLGALRFLTVYLLSGIAGGCFSVIGAWLVGKGHLSAGASGALFGMVGAVVAIRRRELGSFSALTKDPFIRANAANTAIWVAIGVWMGFDNWAHFGGLTAGALATWLFVARGPRWNWALYAAGFAVLVVNAIRPWRKDDDACRLYPALCAPIDGR
jgi:rhomboid protease GluP